MEPRDKVHSSLIDTPEFTRENTATFHESRSSLREITTAFAASGIFTATRYEHVFFCFMIDGFVPGKDDAPAFSHLQDIEYTNNRDEDGLCLHVSFTVKREDWYGLSRESLQLLLVRKLYVAAFHACRTFGLNTRPLIDLCKTFAIDQQRLLTESICNLGALTFNRKVKQQPNELQLHCAFESESQFGTSDEILRFYDIEDKVDELLQKSSLGYTDGHEIGDGRFILSCICNKNPKTILAELRTLPEISTLKNSFAVLTTAKKVVKVSL